MNNKGIWIAGVIALGLVFLLLTRSTNDDHEQTPSPVPTPVPAREPGVRQESLQCPACSGYGHVMVQGRTGMTRRICQFCFGKGGKVLRIPMGHVRCADCEGFGKRPRPGDEASFILCGRCSGRGYIRAPFQPAS